MEADKSFSSASWQIAFVVSFTTGLVPGCASPSATDENVSRQSQELAWGWRDRTYWEAGEEITVCFTGPNTADRALAQDAIESTWGVAANLTFDFTGTCPSSIPLSTFSIYLRQVSTPGGWGGNGEPGKNFRLPPDDPTRSAGWEFRDDLQLAALRDGLISDDFYRGLIVHEMGHSLGFYHEHFREDNPGACSDEPGEGDGDATGWLTEHDPHSIMSYCRDFYGRHPDDYSLSRLDRLGAEMMYPHDFAQKPVVRGAIGAGDLYVSRRGLAHTLLPEWLARGASPSAFGQVKFRKNQTEIFPPGPTWTTTASTEGEATIGVSFVDIRGRIHDYDSPVVLDIDDAKHTALVLSIL